MKILLVCSTFTIEDPEVMPKQPYEVVVDHEKCTVEFIPVEVACSAPSVIGIVNPKPLGSGVGSQGTGGGESTASKN